MLYCEPEVEVLRCSAISRLKHPPQRYRRLNMFFARAFPVLVGRSTVKHLSDFRRDLQLIGEVRQPISAKPGQLERYDCEYKRNGTANLFIFLDVHRPWRKVKVTESRAAVDFATCMRELADLHFPKAERIRVVLDNLSTHSAGALYQAFPAPEARRLLRRLEFHYVPKHASWLNMVEIEIGVLAAQCLDRRIESIAQLTAETAAWEQQRNATGARIKWMFTTEKARAKMGRAYPQPRANSDRIQRVKSSVQRY